MKHEDLNRLSDYMKHEDVNRLASDIATSIVHYSNNPSGTAFAIIAAIAEQLDWKGVIIPSNDIGGVVNDTAETLLTVFEKMEQGILGDTTLFVMVREDRSHDGIDIDAFREVLHVMPEDEYIAVSVPGDSYGFEPDQKVLYVLVPDGLDWR